MTHSPPGPTPTTVDASFRPTESREQEGITCIPRKWVRDAIRVCLDLGYVVTGAQAWHYLKEWRDWREDDVRAFIADEFGSFVQWRRGDIMRVPAKVSVTDNRLGGRGWAVRSA